MKIQLGAIGPDGTHAQILCGVSRILFFGQQPNAGGRIQAICAQFRGPAFGARAKEFEKAKQDLRYCFVTLPTYIPAGFLFKLEVAYQHETWALRLEKE